MKVSPWRRLGRPSSPHARKPVGRARLTVEFLEARDVPSASLAVADRVEHDAVEPAALGEVTEVAWAGRADEARAGHWVARFDGFAGYGPDQASALQERLDEAGLGYRVARWLGSDGTFELQTAPQLGYDDLNRSLAAVGGFRDVTPDALLGGSATPNDPRYPEGGQYGLRSIKAPAAWDVTVGSPAVVVGVIDSGIDFGHPDLAPNVWTNPAEPVNGIDDDGNGFVDDFRGWDFFANDNNPSDEHGHGTHVAGTIGAVGNNNVGVTGVNWAVRLMPLRFLGPANTGFLSAAVSAIDYATNQRLRGVNIRVTNNSWGGGGFFAPLRDAIQRNANAGMLFVASAGNDNSNNDAVPAYPASYDVPNILSVAATNAADQITGFSNFGNSVDIAAPGESVLSTLPTYPVTSTAQSGLSYGVFSGTSMAAPHVSGVAALAFSIYSLASYQDVQADLLKTADPINGTAKPIGGGRLDAAEAVTRTANRAFVFKLYADVLGRAPDAGGFNFHLNNLNAGAVNRLQLGQLFATSDEYYVKLVQRYWQLYLGRPAPAPETNFWLSQFRAQAVTEEGYQSALLASDEYFFRNGGTNRGFVIALYRDVLGRGVSEPEIQGWLGTLNAGASRTAVANAFTNSLEYQRRLVNGYYLTLLKRPASVPEQDGWINVKQTNGWRNERLIAAFTDSLEFYVRKV